jgi:hypothetical protein
MSVFGSYRIEEISRQEMAAADPYQGRGVFLGAPGRSRDEIVEELASRLGMIAPAVTWDGIGAWVDPGSTGMSAGLIRERWDGGRASERE